MKRILFIYCLSIAVLIVAFCQTVQGQTCPGGQTGSYIHLTDATGFDRCDYEEDLEIAASDLSLLIPADQAGNFKVFDYGFYLLNNTYLDGVNIARSEALQQAESTSTNFILFSKQSDASGIYSRIWVDFNLDIFPCLDQDKIHQEVNSYTSWEYDGDAKNYAKIEVEILQLLANRILCCIPENNANDKTFKSLKSDEICIDVELQTDRRLKYLELISSLRCDILNNASDGPLVSTCRNRLDPLTEFSFQTSVGFPEIKIDGSFYNFIIVNDPAVNTLSFNPIDVTPVEYIAINNAPRNGYIYNYGMVKIMTNYPGLQEYLKISQSDLDQTIVDIQNKVRDKKPLNDSDKELILSSINCGANFLCDEIRYILISEFVLGNNKEEWWKEAGKAAREWLSLQEQTSDLLTASEEALVLQMFDDFENPNYFFKQINENPIVAYQMFAGVEVLNKDFLFQIFIKNYSNTDWGSIDIVLEEVNSFLYLNTDYNNTIFIDKYNFFPNGNLIRVAEIESGFIPAPDGAYTFPDSEIIDEVHFLAPIEVGQIETLFQIPEFENQSGATTYLPALVVYEIDRINGNQNLIAASWITAEVVLTFSGIGNLTKLAQLRRLPWLRRIASGAFLLGDAVIPPTNIVLRYSESCTNDDFCKSLREHLVYVEIAIGAKQLTQAMINNVRNSAQAARAKAATNPTNPDEIAAIKYVDAVSEGIGFIKQRLLNKTPEGSKLREYVNDLSETVQATEIRRLEKLLAEALEELSEFGDFPYRLFADDLKNANNYLDLIDLINGRRGSVKSWKVLDDMVDDIGTAWKTDVPTLTKLSDDLVKFPDLEDFLKTNPDHFDAWNSIKHLSSNTRGNPITVQRFKEQLDDFAVYNDPGTSSIAKRNTYKGHTDGFANSSGGKGGHFPEDVGTLSSDGKIIIVDEAQPKSLNAAPFSATEVPMNSLPVNGDGVALATGNNRVYIAQYVLDGNQNPTNVISRYRPKSTGSEHTFFPPGMEWDKIMEQFSSALANPNKVNWGGQSNAWEAVADNGMTFRWYDGQKSVFLKH